MKTVFLGYFDSYNFSYLKKSFDFNFEPNEKLTICLDLINCALYSLA